MQFASVASRRRLRAKPSRVTLDERSCLQISQELEPTLQFFSVSDPPGVHLIDTVNQVNSDCLMVLSCSLPVGRCPPHE